MTLKLQVSLHGESDVSYSLHCLFYSGWVLDPSNCQFQMISKSLSRHLQNMVAMLPYVFVMTAKPGRLFTG